MEFHCDYCGKRSSTRPSHYERKKRHFCSMKCYSDFRRDLLPEEEQNAYGSGFTLAERILRRKARSDINHAIKQGKIHRQPCKICRKAAEAHHPDYTKPLLVEWYCFKHHRQIHENPELLTPLSEDSNEAT